MNIRRQNILGSGPSTCKGPEVGTGPAMSLISQEQSGQGAGATQPG